MKKTKASEPVQAKARIDGVVKDDKFETTNLHLAVWFEMSGKRILTIDKTNPRRAIFVFPDFKERDNLISQFYTKEELQRFIATMQYVKVKLYQNSPPINYDSEDKKG